MNITSARALSDFELIAEVQRLAGSEREAKARLVIHLAELDSRRLYLGAGYSSLFEYCTEVLRLSEHEAYNRIEAARTGRRCPAILDMLVEGSLTLTTVRLLSPHLTPENQHELLAAARGKSKRKVEELIAGHSPKPAVPPLIRKVPDRRSAILTSSPPTAPISSKEDSAPVPPVAMAATRCPPLATPLSSERYHVRFTASAATYQKLKQAQDLLRHAVPDGDPAEILDRALTVLLEDLARKKFAATERPRPGRCSSPASRHIPAEVKRAVWRRDGSRCGFVSKAGRRCMARSLLEFHHLRPYGVGGEATVENIELRCRAHNAYEAELYYGAATRSGPSPARSLRTPLPPPAPPIPP